MLNDDYRDMLQVLLDNGVKFLLVGAYAMGAHGYRHRQTVEIEGMPIPILSYDDLVRNKRATGRDKDRLDADRLEKRGS